MNVTLPLCTIHRSSSLQIPGSKSETNRLLLLYSLFPNLQLRNTSDSDDSAVMQNALSASDTTIDVHHAGTAMRFLTAYFATTENREVILTGSSRMKQRPIKILVEALRCLGADINYIENEGFPPLKITGKKLTINSVSVPANVSSQYISALLLVAPRLQNGLELTLDGAVTSVPYIHMTLGLLNEIGVKTGFVGNRITVKHCEQIAAQNIAVESDWSSASYFYSVVALSGIGTQITLATYKKASRQGDRALAEIYQDFGVTTVFSNDTMQIAKTDNQYSSTLNFNLNDTPDLAQTIAVTCFGLGISCNLTGLHTLRIKETNRLLALQTELRKLGATVVITDDSINLAASTAFIPNVNIATYNDHRMAMAFAPLALKMPITIQDAGVVSKSYPDFWNDLQAVGFSILQTDALP